MLNRRVLWVGIAVLLAGVIAGCSGAPAVAPSLPDGVSLSVYQSRTDLGPRRLQVSVTNGTAEPLTITRLVFDADQFVAPAEWAKDSTTIAAGATADLPVLLGAPACALGDPRVRVELDYRLGDRAERTGRGIPDDPAGRLPEIHEEDCFAASVIEHTAIEASTLPREILVEGRLLAELDLTITPTGSDGSVVVDGVLDTVLLELVDPARGMAVDELPVDTTIDPATEPFTVTLLLAPARCDAHAIAEDKRGTIFPVRATSEAGAGILFVSSTDEVRAGLYNFVRRSCGG